MKKLNKASAYNHMQELIAEIRSEATTYLKCSVHPSNLQPGDMIVATGKVVVQVFDHIFDTATEDTVTLMHGDHLVQFSQVQGLSVVRGTCIEIFRPTS